MNPYESPQTIDAPPPVAEEVLVTTIDFAALAEAAEGCARAGKYYAIAFALTAAVILGGLMMPEEMIKSPWVLLIFTPFLVSLGVLGVGVFWNTIACWQFKLELPDPKLRRLYSRCMNASWIKFALCISMLLIPTPRIYGGHGYVYEVALWKLLWLYVPAIVLLINSVVTIVLHFRGINELAELIQSKTADKLATLYLFSGVVGSNFLFAHSRRRTLCRTSARDVRNSTTVALADVCGVSFGLSPPGRGVSRHSGQPMNPYESPQTLGQPLPMAAEVVDILPEDAILSIATGHCAKAGGLYLIGTALAWLLILLRIFGTGPNALDNVRLVIPTIFLAVISFVFVAWGFLQSLVGYFQLRTKTHDPRLRRNFALIVLGIWLKALLLFVLLFMPELDLTRWRLWDKFRYLIYGGLILASLHAYYLHYRGLQLLAERCEASTPRAAAVFLISCVLFLVGLNATWMWLESPYGETWVVGFGLLATLHIAAYAVGYKQVHHRFRARSARD